MKAKIAENSRRKPAKDQKPKPEKIPVAKKKEEPDPLTSEEKKLLAQFEEDLTTVAKDAHEGFVKLVNACHQIKEKGLYRGQGTFTKYFQMKFGYSRCHANRLADAGRVLEKLSPRGDIFKKLTSESHIRPLTPLLKDEDKLQKVVDLLEAWEAWTDGKMFTPGMVRAAKIIVTPPIGPKDTDKKNEMMEKVTAMIEEVEVEHSKDATKEIAQIFQALKAKAKSLATRRTTNIVWTDVTWNTLQGCTAVSRACEPCYAARLLATRLADMYPGIAFKKGKNCAFTGKILLLPERLGDPLLNKIPTKYFVNSLSDLFHENVPEDFIVAVFEVMEKAHWHTFQVLTKRPERMAEFTQARYNDREAPAHIWMGTTTENQDCFDERIKHLKQVKAAVRWLSCEPLLGHIELSDTDDIGWVVVGGEKNGSRQMEKVWATSLRDQCDRAKIPFLFKQWGDFDEQGTPQKGKKKPKGKNVDETLDGKVHHDYPNEK